MVTHSSPSTSNRYTGVEYTLSALGFFTPSNAAIFVAASFFSVTTSFMRHPPCLLRPPLGLLVHTVAPFVVLRVRG